LKVKSVSYGFKTVNITIVLAFLAYVPVSFIVIYMFGSKVQSDFFTNLDGSVSWEAYVVKIAFMIVICCHIPFMFFCAKESFLCMIDEAIRKSTPKSMDN